MSGLTKMKPCGKQAKYRVSGGGMPSDYAVCETHYNKHLITLRAKKIINVAGVDDPTITCQAEVKA